MDPEAARKRRERLLQKQRMRQNKINELKEQSFSAEETQKTCIKIETTEKEDIKPEEHNITEDKPKQDEIEQKVEVDIPKSKIEEATSISNEKHDFLTTLSSYMQYFILILCIALGIHPIPFGFTLVLFAVFLRSYLIPRLISKEFPNETIHFILSVVIWFVQERNTFVKYALVVVLTRILTAN